MSLLKLQRWRPRHSGKLLLVAVLLVLAWGIRQSRGAALQEIYASIARPFYREPDVFLQAQLTDRRLQELAGRVAELEQQNQQLQSLLGYVAAPPSPTIPAPIVGRSPDEWWKYAILGRGSLDGVSVDDAVTGIGGLVGRISEVTPHSSRVLLISDTNSSIGATASRSRAMGYLQGQGSPLAVMKFYEKVPDIKPADVVVTSSVSRLFPGGLPIGRVKSVNLASGTVPEATVELTAGIEHLEWVAVHLRMKEDE
jgi:rod shape-determining protein MreC